MDLCGLVGRWHTYSAATNSFGRLKPAELQPSLIAVFAVNVLLSQCNDPFSPNHGADGGGLPGHGENGTEGEEVARAELDSFGLSCYRLLSEAGAAFEKDKLISSVSIYMLIKINEIKRRP